MPHAPVRAAALLGLVAACSSPSPGFLGAERTSVTVEGWEIDVYRKGEEAQAIRMTYDRAADGHLMARRGLIAVALVTGCQKLRALGEGDPAIVTVRIGC